MKRVLGVALSCALIAACGSKKEEPATTEPVAGNKPTKHGEVAPKPEAKPKVAAIADKDVLAMVDTWLGAQNDGDFANYQAVYAKRFTGIKRIGPRTFKYDRDGWVEDRGRMFKKKMTVKADDIAVSAGAQSAVVRFAQTWASGKYKDVGPKQLVVVREDGALRIGREEMLQSNVIGAKDSVRGLGRAKFGFVVTEDVPYLVIVPKADGAWGTGDPTLVSRSSPAVARSAVDMKSLPENLRAWKGREVALFDPMGKPCRGKVEELLLLAGFEPHFGTLGEWDGDPQLGSGQRASDQAVAQEIWDMGDDTLMLVGRVSDQCRGALWGRVDDKNLVPRLVEQRDDVDELERAALESFRSLKGYGLIQKDFTAETSEKGNWDEYEGVSPRVAVFLDPKVQRHFVAVEAVAGTGCGSFYGEFWALFQVVPRGDKKELVLLTDEKEPGELFFPAAVIDADADGDVEFVSRNAFVRLVGTVYRITQSWSYPDYDCPC
jgi:hypothetical protein